MPWWPLRKKSAAAAGDVAQEAAEPAEEPEETAGQRNANELAVADAKLQGANKHTDAWFKDLEAKQRDTKENEYSIFNGKSKLNGYHCVIFAGKDKYAGEFKNNQFHGKGEHVFPDGERYDGEWHSGMQHGIGVKSWPDGTKFKGFYRKDARNGLGVCVYPDETRYVYTY